MAVWDPVFDPEIPPKKFMRVPFLRSFSGHEAHQLFSGGAQNEGFRVGAKKFMLKKFMCFSVPDFWVCVCCKEFRYGALLELILSLQHPSFAN